MPKHDRNARTGTGRTDFYDDITNRIIAELEAGCVPWVQPWGTAAAKASLAMPQNASTGRRYSARKDRSSSALMTVRSHSDKIACSWSGPG
jgi:antirestriction protein ArdC